MTVFSKLENPRMRSGLAALLAAFAAAGCSGQSGPVQPGEWEITASTGAANGRQIDSMTTTRCLRARNQGDATREIVLELIGGRCDAEKVRIANGRVGGAFQCAAYYGFSEHKEPVSGRYSPDSIELVRDTPIFGAVLRQKISAKRIGDC